MTNGDWKLVFTFVIACGIWYTAGYLTGYYASCARAYEDGISEGITEASTPSEQ